MSQKPGMRRADAASPARGRARDSHGRHGGRGDSRQHLRVHRGREAGGHKHDTGSGPAQARGQPQAAARHRLPGSALQGAGALRAAGDGRRRGRRLLRGDMRGARARLARREARGHRRQQRVRVRVQPPYKHGSGLGVSADSRGLRQPLLLLPDTQHTRPVPLPRRISRATARTSPAGTSPGCSRSWSR